MILSGQAAAAGTPTVVELFTSQSCSSCPPAEAYLGELAKRPDILALEFHVDYWDDLMAGLSGRWKDAFSKRAYTERQQAYAARLPEGQVYTPQMVIDGRAFAVGSQVGDVERAIKTVHQMPAAALLSLARVPNGLSIDIAPLSATPRQASIWLVRYLEQVETKVRGGENHGRSLTNHHIVTETVHLGDWDGQNVHLVTGAVDSAKDRACAVLLQEAAFGPILAAAPCPQDGL